MELTNGISCISKDLGNLDVADDNIALIKDTEPNTNEG